MGRWKVEGVRKQCAVKFALYLCNRRRNPKREMHVFKFWLSIPNAAQWHLLFITSLKKFLRFRNTLKRNSLSDGSMDEFDHSDTHRLSCKNNMNKYLRSQVHTKKESA